MTPNLKAGVRRRLESPEEGTPVRLIVGVEAISSEVTEQLEQNGATVHDELPLNYVSVSTTEDQISGICDLDFVTSVEIDDEGQVFSPDFRSHVG